MCSQGSEHAFKHGSVNLWHCNSLSLAQSGSATVCPSRRVILLMLMGMSVGANIVVEQPGSSLLDRHDRWVEMSRRLKMWTLRFTMSAFGSPTRKPTIIWSNNPNLLRGIAAEAYAGGSCSKMPKVTTCRKYVDKQGKKRCTGTKELKETQREPQHFGDYRQVQ